ncbi:MAG: hypothetical protein H8D87_11360 [Deltaproteobacteria bacterium]|uniref:hypothetical protein n=1 Tax=Desulfobacula sp. TaxID=2593537 RepID=UPI0019AD072A|nr:hypothetical protein [Candidatus Desulfobacula maris]MBL6994306.1 hypothetical protein [Desulfobacula sp.]
MKNKYLGIIFICLLLVINISGSHAQTVLSDEISIAIPRNVIIQMIETALPLNLEKGQYFKGSLLIQAIKNLEIGSNMVEFEMTINGKDIKFETKLGNQALLMDIGNLNADVSCSVSLRYDAPKRFLYITPYILQIPNENKADKMAANLLQLLSLGNGIEYPVEIQKFTPFITKIGSDQFNIDMDITNIYTENDKVFISGQSKLEKVKSPAPSVKKSE